MLTPLWCPGHWWHLLFEAFKQFVKLPRKEDMWGGPTLAGAFGALPPTYRGPPVSAPQVLQPLKTTPSWNSHFYQLHMKNHIPFLFVRTCFANPKWIEGMHRHLLEIFCNFRALLFSSQTLLWLAPQDHPKRPFSLHIPRVIHCQVFNLRGIHKKLLTFPFCHYFNHFCTFLYYRVLLQQLLFTTFLVKLPSWASASTHCPGQVVVAAWIKHQNPFSKSQAASLCHLLMNNLLWSVYINQRQQKFVQGKFLAKRCHSQSLPSPVHGRKLKETLGWVALPRTYPLPVTNTFPYCCQLQSRLVGTGGPGCSIECRWVGRLPGRRWWLPTMPRWPMHGSIAQRSGVGGVPQHGIVEERISQAIIWRADGCGGRRLLTRVDGGGSSSKWPEPKCKPKCNL